MTRNRRADRHPWSAVEVQLLREFYADTSTALIATALNLSVDKVYRKARGLGLEKSEAYMASPDACRLRRGDNVGMDYQFPRGHVPANKGTRRPGYAPGRMASTQFKSGSLNGRAAQLVVPVGSVRINGDGYLDRKVSDQPGPQTLRWKAVHRLVWEAAHGPVPAGHVVAFKPGRRTAVEAEITVDALQLITLRENMARNSVHNMPKELASLVQLRGALNRSINARSKKS